MKQQDLSKMCEIKVHVMRTAVVPDNLSYCRNVCTGYPEDDKCPHGLYRPVGLNVPLRQGKIAYEVMREIKQC